MDGYQRSNATCAGLRVWAKLAEATAGYKRYVTAQVDAQVTKTQELADAVKAGDVERAKALFPVARTYWERIEPVAESFGDIDPKIDGREDDERGPGVAWTGYHRLEKDLWVDGLQPDSAHDMQSSTNSSSPNGMPNPSNEPSP